jgi:ABC-type phosphate/phosphonate transport system permease subunit
MLVKDPYASNGLSREMSVLELIQTAAFGCGDSRGTIETLETRIALLERMLAAVLERLDLSDQEVLEITGCSWRFGL